LERAATVGFVRILAVEGSAADGHTGDGAADHQLFAREAVCHWENARINWPSYFGAGTISLG
tara:strand:- start:281 stop:466 length:186 start_codon:yes stop_codon:yes gene_type:complete